MTMFSGGKENDSPACRIVKSNYRNAQAGDEQILIRVNRKIVRLSVETLESIVRKAKAGEIEHLEDGCEWL